MPFSEARRRLRNLKVDLINGHIEWIGFCFILFVVMVGILKFLIMKTYTVIENNLKETCVTTTLTLHTFYTPTFCHIPLYGLFPSLLPCFPPFKEIKC